MTSSMMSHPHHGYYGNQNIVTPAPLHSQGDGGHGNQTAVFSQGPCANNKMDASYYGTDEGYHGSDLPSHNEESAPPLLPRKYPPNGVPHVGVGVSPTEGCRTFNDSDDSGVMPPAPPPLSYQDTQQAGFLNTRDSCTTREGTPSETSDLTSSPQSTPPLSGTPPSTPPPQPHTRTFDFAPHSQRSPTAAVIS